MPLDPQTDSAQSDGADSRDRLAAELAGPSVSLTWGDQSETGRLREGLAVHLGTYSDAAVEFLLSRCCADEVLRVAVAAAVMLRHPEGIPIAYCLLGWSRDPEAHAIVAVARDVPEVRAVLDRVAPTPSPALKSIDAYVRTVKALLDAFRPGQEGDGILQRDDWNGATSERLDDPALAQLILDRPDDAERIADIVITHRIGRGAEVAAVLDGSATALAKGAL